jgi:hypothetical protein
MEQTVHTTQPEVTQPTQPTSALFATLMALVENHIRDIVTMQVNEILMNHRTMRLIDEGFISRVQEIAKDVAENVVSTHVDDEYHISEDAINDIATSAVEDHDFDSQISDAVNDAINDFDFSDVVTASIKDNVTITATISVD